LYLTFLVDSNKIQQFLETTQNNSEGEWLMHNVQQIVREHLPHSSIKDIELIAGGVTGTIVAKVVLRRKGDSCPRRLVVKAGPRVTVEVAGYKFLSEYEIVSYLPSVIFNGLDYIGMSFVQSVGTFVEVVIQGKLRVEQMHAIFQKILDLKRQLWLDGRQVDSGLSSAGYYRSIIRSEFQDTARVLKDFFREESVLPIVIGDETFPSLDNILATISSFLYSEAPVQLVPSHGDLKAENILITQKGNFRILDLEWTGYCDWVESLSRMGKWCSSKTSVLTEKALQTNDNGHLTLQYRLKHQPTCRLFQQMAMQRGEEIAAVLGDKDWKRRWNYYLAASLLREIILLERRRIQPSTAIALLGETAKLVKRA